jgi:hypothetical protein
MALGADSAWVPGIFLGGKARPARKANNINAICEPIVQAYSIAPQPSKDINRFKYSVEDTPKTWIPVKMFVLVLL